jgi:mono/diheme cytochrome c family protein
MKLNRIFLCALAGLFFAVGGLFAAGFVSANGNVTTRPVYVPDVSHANDPLPDGVLAWNSLMLATNAAADQSEVHFTFTFSNVAKRVDVSLATNVVTTSEFIAPTNITDITQRYLRHVVVHHYLTNIVTVTNSVTPISVTILNVHPSCGCTTAQLPPTPWTIPPGAFEQIPVTVNIVGKHGMLPKSINVSTDHGSKGLWMSINILPPVVPKMTDADRARGISAAKADRQAVFHDDCATCHIQKGEGKYGKDLYDSVCAVCHEASPRATMVPDLHNLKVSTSDAFWRTWIAHGKAGSLMPAFSTTDGGPLSDLQIASLAVYLDQVFPSKVPSPE